MGRGRSHDVQARVKHVLLGVAGILGDSFLGVGRIRGVRFLEAGGLLRSLWLPRQEVLEVILPLG